MEQRSLFIQGWRDHHQLSDTPQNKNGGIIHPTYQNSKLQQFLQQCPKKLEPCRTPDEGVCAVLLPDAENVRTFPTPADPPKHPILKLNNSNLISNLTINSQKNPFFIQSENNKRDHKNTSKNHTMYCSQHEVFDSTNPKGGYSQQFSINSEKQKQKNYKHLGYKTIYNDRNACNNPTIYNNTKGEFSTPNSKHLTENNQKNNKNRKNTQKNLVTFNTFMDATDSGYWGDSILMNLSRGNGTSQALIMKTPYTGGMGTEDCWRGPMMNYPIHFGGIKYSGQKTYKTWPQRGMGTEDCWRGPMMNYPIHTGGINYGKEFVSIKNKKIEPSAALTPSVIDQSSGVYDYWGDYASTTTFGETIEYMWDLPDFYKNEKIPKKFLNCDCHNNFNRFH